MSQNKDVVSRIRAQHDKVRRLFEEAAEPGDEAADAFRALVRLLAVHETAEEIVVYPTLNSLGREARAAAHARKVEERRCKIELAELEGTARNSAEFANRLESLRVAVETHAAAEEGEVLPILEDRCSAGRLQAIDRLFVGAQLVAPTHAHRLAPVGAVGNLAVGPMVGMFDRFRDATTNRHH
jgi:hemerythrin superfamily protein